MIIRTDNEKDPGMPDELRGLVDAWNGKREILKMSHDQAAKAAYIVAAQRPCYICASGAPAVIGKLRLERLGQWLIYGVCESCMAEHMPEALKNLVAKLFEEDSKGGVTVAKPALLEERGL
jgi:hypothetical protein